VRSSKQVSWYGWERNLVPCARLETSRAQFVGPTREVLPLGGGTYGVILPAEL
jgi:hypothetical protein